jgi:formylglycine-generating enzyme required for sulfatase activity
VRWTGDEKESLEGAANLADAYCKRNGAPPSWAVEEWLDDGNSVHAPVGSYRANAFGLHDVLGNVFEWCRDLYDDYRKRVRPGDGEREVGRFSDSRVFRGGAFSGTASLARSAHREFDAPDEAGNAIGVRPARSLTPWCSVPQLR